ncbi:hypothetical protein [Streptomyces sp. NPDC046939]|uniref:hypothetical protein n=1 Tax=Streptomyces sp. NPDC046939 TaxID=3155376 RepID=UPI003407C8AF
MSKKIEKEIDWQEGRGGDARWCRCSECRAVCRCPAFAAERAEHAVPYELH